MNTRRSNVVPLPGVQQAPVIEPIRLEYPADLEQRPAPPRWLVDGVLLPGTVCLLTGAQKIGKSLAAQQLLIAIALGREWMGRQVEQARCLAIFAEDRPDSLRNRAIDICEHYGVHQSVLDREFAWDAREDRDSVMWQTEFGRGKPTEFWYQVFGRGYGQPGLVEEDGFRVVVLDTAATVYQGNHNAPEQVSAFMRALTREAVRHNCVIILNAHPAKSAPTSFGGNSQWLAAARFGFNLSRPSAPPGFDEEEMSYGENRDRRIFRGLGANYAATPRPEQWRWNRGVFELDEVAEPRRRGPRKITDADRSDLQYRMLLGLKRALQAGVKCPADVLASRSLPNLAKAYGPPECRDVTTNDLYAAQEALLQSGMLVMVQVGGARLIRPADGPYYDGESSIDAIK